MSKKDKKIEIQISDSKVVVGKSTLIASISDWEEGYC